ncbi:MAG: hypothetical protein QXM50_07790, partial [Candidatus Caldarchaeum sp.]
MSGLRVVVDESALRLGVAGEFVEHGGRVLVHRALLKHLQERAFSGDLAAMDGLRNLMASRGEQVEFVGEAGGAGWREAVLEYCRSNRETLL